MLTLQHARTSYVLATFSHILLSFSIAKAVLGSHCNDFMIMSCRGLRHVCCDLAVGGLVEVSAWGQQAPLVGIQCPVTAAEQARHERPDSESARLRKTVSTHRPATCRAVFRPRAHASVQPPQSQPVYASTDVIMMRLNRRELDGRGCERIIPTGNQ